MECDIRGTGAYISVNRADKCIIPPSLQEGVLHYAVENTQFGFTHLVTACKKAQTHSEKAASRARSDTHNTCACREALIYGFTHIKPAESNTNDVDTN